MRVQEQNDVQFMFGVDEFIFQVENIQKELTKSCNDRAKTKADESLQEINKRIQDLLDHYQKIKLAAINEKLISEYEINLIENIAYKNVKQTFYPDYQRQFKQKTQQIQTQTTNQLQAILKKQNNIVDEFVARTPTHIVTLGGVGVATVFYPPLITAYVAVGLLAILDTLITSIRLIAQHIKAGNLKTAEPGKISSLQEQMQNDLLLKPELKCRQRLFQLAQTCKTQHLVESEKKESDESLRQTMVKA